MSDEPESRRGGVLIGDGASPNYLALLLILAGALLGMCAVYYHVKREPATLPLAAGLLCALAGCALVILKKDK